LAHAPAYPFVANLVDLAHCFAIVSQAQRGPPGKNPYPMMAANSCVAAPNICQVKPATVIEKG
jgi:hypothetical protein